MNFYYTKQGYALITSKTQEPHSFGGESCYKGADCPVCRKPLLLLADLDCTSIRKSEKAKLFHELDTLPLYYCWRCCAEKLSYLVTSRSSIKVLRNEGRPQGDDFPYENYPDKFERHPIKLVPIPYETSKLLAIAQEVDEDWLSEQDLKAALCEVEKLRQNWTRSYQCFNRHQIGGLLNLQQSHERVGCPNPKCEQYKSFEAGYASQMKELAVIHNDPNSGLPMIERMEDLNAPSSFNDSVQVVYWVCEECLCIAASNRCD